MKYIKEKEICNKYLSSRKDFLEFADKSSALRGNDNIIGRIGEFVVLQFLEDEGRDPEINTSKNEKGFDILCDYNSLKGKKDSKISVKVITSENKYGRTTRIKNPWHELFIVILGQDYKIEKIGRLRRSEFEFRRVQNPELSIKEPYAEKKLLEKGGLFYKYGEIYDKEFCSKYL
ncbi:MAG: hypothetical protein M0R16_01850 [Bacteroidales bacterium]|jgi:hypothetical protein|nr:hypothetical protein [Bacteroidales bacterium]